MGKFSINLNQVKSNLYKSRFLYILFIPVFIYYVLFQYLPMAGIVIAFKRYSPSLGIMESPWVGFRYFTQFFESIYFWRLLRNTLMLNLYDLVISFPAPIILALLLNEVSGIRIKRMVQTISYLPHFVSMVVVVSMLVNFLSPEKGLINNLIAAFGGNRIYFLAEPRYFWGIYTGLNIWKGVGWGSIIYIASITGIDPQQYEAAKIDGAGRWQQLIHITLPCISNTIIILFLLKIGHLLEIGYQTIILMYNSSIYETADVIGSYIYRRGLVESDYSFATAVGIIQSLVGLVMVILSNRLARKYSESSLW